MTRILLILPLLFLLTACLSPEERARIRTENAERQRQADQAQCRHFGYSFGTPDFSDCLFEIHKMRREDALKREMEREKRRLIEAERKKDCTKTHTYKTLPDGTRERIEKVYCR